MLAFFLACQLGPTKPDQKDRELYLKALRAPAETAAASCGEIAHEALRGECILFAAKSAVGERKDGIPICEKAPTQDWVEACRFEVIDAAGTTGQQASRLCATTGQFETRCLYHALQREERSLAARFPKGEEEALIEELLLRLGKKGELEEDKISESLPAKIIARRFFRRHKDSSELRFSMEACGSAPKSVCSQAYRFVVHMQKEREGKRLPRPCSIPISEAQVISAELVVWEDSFHQQALDVWENLCRQSKHQK